MVLKKIMTTSRRKLDSLLSSSQLKRRGVYVSVIVPVFNTELYLHDLLDSLVAQDLPSENFEVIAVNDGSTDASGKILDDYADRYANFHVIHQENSGWAGKPRNVAMAHASGKYLFFADGDDKLAPQSLRRMVEFATKHRIDVLLPKVVGIGGRKQTSSIYGTTNPAITPLEALKSLTPQKLVSRRLIESNQLRFAEEPVRLEDGMFMVACYLLARRIGVVADYEFYNLRERTDKSNISYRPLVPRSYTESIAKIASIIDKYSRDENQTKAMILTLWRRKGLKIYEPQRFKKYSVKIQDEWIEAHSRFLKEFVPTELAMELNQIQGQKTELIRAQNRHAVLAISALEGELNRPISVFSSSDVNSKLEILGMVTEDCIDAVSITARVRGDNTKVLSETTHAVVDRKFEGVIPGLTESTETIDFFVQALNGALRGNVKRLAVLDDAKLSGPGTLKPYATKNGYFSLSPRI